MNSSYCNIFASLAHCARNALLPVYSPHKGPVLRGVDFFLDIGLNKLPQLSWVGFGTPWRHWGVNEYNGVSKHILIFCVPGINYDLCWQRWFGCTKINRQKSNMRTKNIVRALTRINMYCQVSSIRRTKSQHLKDPRTVLWLSLSNPLKPDVKSRMKMLLEQRRQVMLQLHLSDRQCYCLIGCHLY